MWLPLHLELLQHRLSWRLSEWWANRRFAWSSNLFSAGIKARESRSQYALLAVTFRETASSVAFAALSVALLYLLDRLVVSSALWYGLGDLKGDGYVELLAAISSVGGVFIALYYTALTAVASSVFSQLPSRISQTLGRELQGAGYIRFLAFLTSLALILLASTAFGLPRPILAPPLLALLSAVGVFAFVRLGQRAFYLFDPARLSYPLLQDLFQWARQAAIRSHGSRDRSFQRHCHVQAVAVVEQLEVLTIFAKRKDQLSGRPLAEIAQGILRLLAGYQSLRSQIPPGSYWYRLAQEHADWFLTPDTQVSMAHATGTRPHGSITTDRDWLEKALLPLVYRALSAQLRAMRFELAYQLLDQMGGFFRYVAAIGEVGRALGYADQAAETLLHSGVEQNATEQDRRESLELVALLDRLASFPIDILLGMDLPLQTLNRDTMAKRIEATNWRRLSSVFRGTFKPLLLHRIEWMVPRLAFERLSEGRVVTPTWYLVELVSQIEAEAFQACVDDLLLATLGRYQNWAEALESSHLVWSSAAVVSRQLEYVSKLASRLDQFSETWRDLGKGPRVKGLPWPQSNPADWATKVRDVRLSIAAKMAQKAPSLLPRARPQGVPDFAGQFVHETAEHILEACLSNSTETLETLFPAYFGCCWMEFSAHVPTGDFDGWRSEHRLLSAIAPVQDLLTLSGYALLFSELHQNPALWQVVKGVWDKRLGSDQGQALMAAIAGQLSFVRAQLSLGHRSLVRTQWLMRASHALSSLDRRLRKPGGRPFDEEIVHPSPLVRHVARYTNFPSIDGDEIFVALYLRKHPTGAAVQWPRDLHRLAEAVERENGREEGDESWPESED